MRTVLTVFLSVFFSLLLAANNLSITENGTSQLKLHFELGDYQMNSATSKTPVVMQKSTGNYVLNNYNLPLFNYMIQVPNHCKAVARITNLKRTTQEHFELTAIDRDIPINEEFTSVSTPFVLRNNILSTLMIQPFVYASDTQQIQILTEADIEIDFVPDNSVSVNRDIRQSKQFKDWLSKSVINYRDNTRTGEATGCLLIVYNSSATTLTNIQPLIDWKHQKGWEVHTVNSQTIGNTTTAIKNYIQTAYDTWTNPPEYILMIGKAVQNNNLPTYWVQYNYNTVGDYQYCLLDGSDIIPDAYIGRFSFSTSTQLSAMISKTISYEKMQGFTTYDWYNKAILCTDETDSGPSCTTTIDYVKDLMNDYSPATQISYINSGTLSSQMMSAMNGGASNFYYRGHNGYSGLTNSNISNLVNSGRYPFICFITCFSGNYGTYSSNCIGDQFMRVGTSTTPLGGVGFIGAACETHTCLNNIMTGAVAYGFYKEGLTNQGQALLRAKIGLLACYPQYPDDYIPQNFQSVNLLGDPTVDIWLKQPTPINVSYPSTVPIANGFLPVTVTDLGGNPAPNAKVCLLKGSDEIFQTGFTDANGVIVFSWNTVVAGTGKVTVTSPEYYTFQSSVSFASQTNAFSLVNASSFNQLDSGTVYSFPITITNNQYSSISNVTAVLTSSSGVVNVTAGNLTFGDMSQSQSSTSTLNAGFGISESCAAGEVLAFKLHITGTYNTTPISYDLYFQVNENGPDLTISNTQVGTDNVLIPGEYSQLTVTLKNLGLVTASSVSAHLSCPNPNITVTAANQNFGNIASNMTAVNTAAFFISANSSIYIGTPVKLILDLTYNSGSIQSISKDITIGNLLPSAMTGPDAYGYICVANGDSHPLAQPYSWIEINPNLGGNGTVLALSDNNTDGSGSYSTISLPFSFRYYGIMYNQITICSNGFIMPGANGSQEWMNWALPGPMVPKPIIAPFWDDLIIQTASKIVYKYDNVNHKFIVEWSQLKSRYDQTQTETFEVVIFDVLTYPTSTGDNALLFQYSSFHNVDAGNYGVDYVDHGQYATVGIADHTGLLGLQYTYQAFYPTSATPLTNNSTLYFTTVPNYTAAPIPVVLSCPLIEITAVYPNNQIDSGEVIALSPIISNSGFGNLKSSTVQLVTSDPYISISNEYSSLGEIMPGQNGGVVTPLTFTVATNCPNMRQVTFHLQFTNADGVYTADFSIVVHSPQVHFISCSVNGSFNPVLNPNSTVPVVLLLENVSNLPIPNGIFTLQQSSNIMTNPTQFNFNIPGMSTLELDFNLTIGGNASLGNELLLSGLFSIPDIYDSLFTMPMMVGNWSDLVMETFDSTILGEWNMSQGVSIATGNHIHTTGSEVIISPSGTDQTYQIESPIINGLDCQRVQVEFSYCNLNPTVANAIYVSYDQGNTWNSLFTYNTVHTTPVQVQFSIEDLPANMQTMKFKWVTVTQSDNNGQIILDDMHIQAIHHSPGYFDGNVSLECFPNLVTQVKISSLYLPEQYVYAPLLGHFILPLYQGTYSYIKAEMPGFMTVYLNNVTIVSDQNTYDDGFIMSYLQKPINLQNTLNEAVLNLTWLLESPPDKSGNRLIPEYYRIYLEHDNVTIEDSSAALTYQTTLSDGDYTIYVKGIFHDAMNKEVLSGSSNVLNITCTANEDVVQTPDVFALYGNYPNPFNPTTTISYSLQHAGMATLRIYNIKGQLVNTLVNEIKAPGKYTVAFDGTDANRKNLASGVYFYRLTSGNQTTTNKMILIK